MLRTEYIYKNYKLKGNDVAEGYSLWKCNCCRRSGRSFRRSSLLNEVYWAFFLCCQVKSQDSRARLKCDGTRTETRFGLSAKRTSPFKLAGAPVQSTTGSRHVRISASNGSNAGYTVFRGRVQDYWLPSPLACFPFNSLTVRHRVPSGFN